MILNHIYYLHRALPWIHPLHFNWLGYEMVLTTDDLMDSTTNIPHTVLVYNGSTLVYVDASRGVE